MMMSDVNESVPPKQKGPTTEMLKAAVPDNIKRTASAAEVNALIANAAKKPEMTPNDFSKMIVIDNLPSRYLRYPQGTKLYGRPLEIKELKKLANINAANASTTIDDLLRAIIKGIAFEDILRDDKLYLILWLRANTYPESGFSVPFICPDCDREASFDFKVDNININYIREDMQFEEPVEMPNGDFIVFKYPTIKDEQRVENFKDSVRKSYMKYDDETLALTMSINTINGKTMPLLDMYNYISNVKVYSQIKGYTKEFDFGISELLTVKCNNCGGTAQAGLSFREDFVIPPYRFTKYSRNGVQNQRDVGNPA